MTRKAIGLLLGGAFFLLITSKAQAYKVDEDLEVFGYFQSWLTIYEQLEDAKGQRQNPSGDQAATHTTGFSLQRARIGLRLNLFSKRFTFHTQIRLEEVPGVLDLYLRATIFKWLAFRVGQFKAPGTREYLTDNRDLDFILRTNLASNIADYSFSRTTYTSSLFYGNKSYGRDFGAAVEGEIDVRIGLLRYMFMVGNGLGANLFISGSNKPEFILTNRPQFFYGVRVCADDLFGVVSIGGHFSYNKHDNMLFKSFRAVFDLNRKTASGDVAVTIPRTGVTLSGAYGWGVIDDDFDNDHRTDFQYQGWESRVVYRLNPLLARLTRADWLKHHLFKLTFRFDNLTSESDDSGVRIQQNNYTMGINYHFRSFLKVQLNYIIKKTKDPANPDLDDNVLFINMQGAF